MLREYRTAARICQYDATYMSDQKRSYRMRRRAELEELTRLRITESAVELHETLGPARTSISGIAERAGVRRSTVYRHFPNEDALFAACSSHWRAANPPPDPQGWSTIEDPAARTEAALRELYAFYGRTREMYTSLLRDELLVPAVERRLRARGDRPRPRVRDVAIAEPGAEADRRRCRLAHVHPRRGSRRTQRPLNGVVLRRLINTTTEVRRWARSMSTSS
jgi:AcrR family transcriptional regulator